MSILENDWLYWALGSILALSGLIRLSKRRREQLTETLREFVIESQKSSTQASKNLAAKTTANTQTDES